eukprot:CAMPEP_0184646728 /NCGR_PEP_ID=MMETSP0308-20130426/3480_1 /TAXON_ID=38269 /ORGANISM="Gloeochaete witrockiana, Strain SAG 46.84" /LENGTH=299 /DNA_ID=CAMNT_0027077015 /DNA_START=372 /DNA_END=1271 /DNA_ORIENTATION=-
MKLRLTTSASVLSAELHQVYPECSSALADVADTPYDGCSLQDWWMLFWDMNYRLQNSPQAPRSTAPQAYTPASSSSSTTVCSAVTDSPLSSTSPCMDDDDMSFPLAAHGEDAHASPNMSTASPHSAASKRKCARATRVSRSIKRHAMCPSGYTIFKRMGWKHILEEAPGSDFKEVNRRGGEMWNSLSPEQKKPFYDMAAAERAAAETDAPNPHHMPPKKQLKCSSNVNSRSPLTIPNRPVTSVTSSYMPTGLSMNFTSPKPALEHAMATVEPDYSQLAQGCSVMMGIDDLDMDASLFFN